MANTISDTSALSTAGAAPSTQSAPLPTPTYSFPVGSAGYQFQWVNQPLNYLPQDALPKYQNLVDQQQAWDQAHPSHGGKDDKANPFDQQINNFLDPYLAKFGTSTAQQSNFSDRYNFDANGNVVDPTVCKSFADQIIPELTMALASAAFAPAIGAMLPGAATAGAAATPLNIGLSNALTSGAITQGMGGNGLIAGLTAGVGAGLQAAGPMFSNPLSNVSSYVNEGLQNLGVGAETANTIGNSFTNALGRSATSAGLAALTGGNVGRAAEAGAIAGGVSPIVNDVIGKTIDLTDPTSKTLANIAASGLSQGAATSLLGGKFGTGLESGLITGGLSALRGALRSSPPGLSTSDDKAARADYLANNPDAIQSSVNDMNLVYSGDINRTLDTINGVAPPDTTTQNLTPEELASGITPVNPEDIAANAQAGEQAGGQALQDYANQNIPDVTVTASRDSIPANLTPVTPVVTSPLSTVTDNTVSNVQNNNLEDVVVTGQKQQPDLTPVTPVVTSPLSTVSDSPLNDTEIQVTGKKPTSDFTPIDVPVSLPPIDPNDLNFKQPELPTDTGVKSSASGTGVSTGTSTGKSSQGASGAQSGLSAAQQIYGPEVFTIHRSTGSPIEQQLQQISSKMDVPASGQIEKELSDLLQERGYDVSQLGMASGGSASLSGYADGDSVSSDDTPHADDPRVQAYIDKLKRLSQDEGGGLANLTSVVKCISPNITAPPKPMVTVINRPRSSVSHNPLSQIYSQMAAHRTPYGFAYGDCSGMAKGGLPSKYHEAAPKGHKPEFITGLTGYYADGRGTGQSDDIPAMLHDGDYVMDAETVAQLGDGSSKAGRQVLEGFMHQVPHSKAVGGSVVPAKIADGEFVFPAAFVSAIGKGDNKAGAKILDGLREKLREHKRSAPVNKIPPKAKSPLDYIEARK